MRNKKVLAIVMAVMTAASALVGCGATECSSSCGYRCHDGKRG